MGRLVLLAIGGNALIRPNQSGTAEEQFDNAMQTAAVVVRLIKAGYRVVLTHGNGPQIGAALIRSEFAARDAYRLPYDCCVAATQGEIGYILQYAMWQMLQKERLHVPVVSLVTQVVVRRDDPAFDQPTKPIGPFYTREEADHYQVDLGWKMVEIPCKGFRRVVPSPHPVEIVEIEAIQSCVEKGVVTIAAGGGGIPVTNDHDITKGVEAVVDKDMTSALLARQLHADVFVIATGEEKVYFDYGTPGQRGIQHLTSEECRELLDRHYFPAGSMEPKIQAAINYLESGGYQVIITDIPHLMEAIEGKAGTHIEPSSELFEWP